jgi:hypothetical protein
MGKSAGISYGVLIGQPSHDSKRATSSALRSQHNTGQTHIDLTMEVRASLTA